MSDTLNFEDLYDFKKLLGEGAFGKVYKVTGKGDDTAFALKLMQIDKLSDFSKKSVEKEVELMTEIVGCGNEYIPCYYALLKGTFQGKLYYGLLMDYIEGHELSDFIHHNRMHNSVFQIDEMLSVMRDTLSALVTLHAKNIAHRDIKPANIMVSKDRTYLVDYGFSCIAGSHERFECERTSGTPNYMSPESAFAKHNLRLWITSDVYSLGLTFWSMSELRSPYPQQNLRCNYFNKTIADIINAMIIHDYDSRLTAEDALEYVNYVIDQREAQLGGMVLGKPPRKVINLRKPKTKSKSSSTIVISNTSNPWLAGKWED